jgi:hypothetical protein
VNPRTVYAQIETLPLTMTAGQKAVYAGKATAILRAYYLAHEHEQQRSIDEDILFQQVKALLVEVGVLIA